MDASYRSTIAGINNSLQVYVGHSSLKLSGDGVVKSRSAWGFNDSVETGALTLRLAFLSGKTSLDYPGINGVIDGLNQFAAGAAAVPLRAFQAAAAGADDLSRKYKLTGIDTRVFTVGASHDPGNWFV